MAIYGAVHWWSSRPVDTGPGILAKADPVQRVVDQADMIEHAEYQLEPLARIKVKARVLGVKNYRFDSGADLVPTDLALGWGRMSDQQVLEDIDISQSNRFYFWRTESFPIPRQEIERHSANMHMIPSDRLIKKQLIRVREGQVVELEGYLVRARRPDGWHWQSSLTRDDTGAGACELIWVQKFRTL